MRLYIGLNNKLQKKKITSKKANIDFKFQLIFFLVIEYLLLPFHEIMISTGILSDTEV